MPTCANPKYLGRDVILEYAIQCGDVVPTSGQWKRVGSLRTKEFTLEWDTTDTTADDSIGALRENLATFQTMSITGDGTAKAFGAGSANLIELTKHVAKPDATGGQPVAWIRLTFPDLTFTCFMIVTNMSRSAPYDDVATFSFEASATASDFGLLVDDTPDPDAPAVTGVTVSPDTLPLEVGETGQLTVVVAPTGSDQGVTYGTSAPLIATVSGSGLVTAVAAGTATITVYSDEDDSFTDTCAVTVTAP
jgi:predicted secreted protein